MHIIKTDYLFKYNYLFLLYKVELRKLTNTIYTLYIMKNKEYYRYLRKCVKSKICKMYE